jgi:hypothetical protein
MPSPTPIAISTVVSPTNNTITSYSSATLSWLTGDVFIVDAVNEGINAATWSISNTGTGLSWTTKQIHNTSGSDCGIVLYTATATANGSGVVTVTQSLLQNMALGVYQWRAPSGFTIAVGATQLLTGLTTSPQRVTIPMTSPDSAVVWMGGDWSAAAVESPSPAASSHTATTPGPSVSPQSGAVSTRFTYFLSELDDQVATGSQSFGYTGSSTGPFSIVVAEVSISSPADNTTKPGLPGQFDDQLIPEAWF